MVLPGFRQLPQTNEMASQAADGWQDEEPPYVRPFLLAQKAQVLRAKARAAMLLMVGVAAGLCLTGLAIFILRIPSAAMLGPAAMFLAWRYYAGAAVRAEMESRDASREAEKFIKVLPKEPTVQ